MYLVSTKDCKAQKQTQIWHMQWFSPKDVFLSQNENVASVSPWNHLLHVGHVFLKSPQHNN